MAIWSPDKNVAKPDRQLLVADTETGRRLTLPRGMPSGEARAWMQENGLVPVVEGGSGYTLTNNEVLYASIGAGTNLNTFTAEDNLQKTLAPVVIPAGFFFNNSANGKVLRVKAAGQLGTSGAPTFTWSIRLLTTTTWSAGGVLLGTSAALTAGTTQTLAPWFLDAEIVMRSVGIGATSTLATMGEIRSPLGLASPFAGTIPANNVAPTVATLDNSVTYYLFLSAACGTSNALNLINLQQIKVYGEN